MEGNRQSNFFFCFCLQEKPENFFLVRTEFSGCRWSKKFSQRNDDANHWIHSQHRRTNPETFIVDRLFKTRTSLTFSLYFRRESSEDFLFQQNLQTLLETKHLLINFENSFSIYHSLIGINKKLNQQNRFVFFFSSRNETFFLFFPQNFMFDLRQGNNV